jgi:multiple sugar transport system permease protein
LQVLLPSIRGSVVSAGILSLAFIWNEFLLGYSLTFDENARPATVAVALLRGSYQQPWGELCAAAAVVALPLALAVFLLQGRLVAGLSAGLGREA